MLVAALTLCIGGSGIFIDGVTAASATATPTPPTLSVSTPKSSPPIVNNTIRTLEGQSIQFAVSAADPNGYSTLRLQLLSALPPGAKYVAHGTSGTFSWTPVAGSSQSHPKSAVKFEAVNYFLGTSTSLLVTLAVDDNLAPSFDPSIPLQQSAVVGETLKFPVTADPDPDDDSVNIQALGLPAGATLGKSIKNAKTGKWTALLTWTPTPAQVNKSFPVTLIARDDILHPAQTTYPVVFNTSAPVITDGTIKAVTISQSQWKSSASLLSASGAVKFTKHYAMVVGLNVTLTNGDTGAFIGTAPVANNGAWKFSGNPADASVPCRIQAEVGGRTAVYTVKKAPPGCS